MTIKNLAGIVGALTTLLGAAFFMDARYFHTLQAAELREQVQKEAAKTSAELRMEIARTRVQFLRSKKVLTDDDKDELNYNLKLIDKLKLESLK